MYKFKKCVRAKRSVSTFFQQLEALFKALSRNNANDFGQRMPRIMRQR